MKYLPIFIASLLITTTYAWWQNGKYISITPPSESQLKEMIGTSNTPIIPLTPIKN
tara:strand:+ start:2040 stop:2207 length:168 start_codon:yes stop_codon:yes gene_type:complete